MSGVNKKANPNKELNTVSKSENIWTKSENVRQQYSDDKNLSIRLRLHAKHSVNKQGFIPWLFEQYRFTGNDSVLELGCGSGGQWEGRFEQLPCGCSLVLSDFSEGMVDVVKGKFSSHQSKHQSKIPIEFQKIDIQDIPFEDESFNIVIANYMLYHVPDLDKALSEVWRVLKPGGYFYSSTSGNGGMQLYLHDVMKKFDPETEAFMQELSFNLQNGGELLRQYFSSVERFDYKDSLAITETQDLIDWIKSTTYISNCSEENINELYEYFEALRIKDGTINIPKEAGLFISVK